MTPSRLQSANAVSRYHAPGCSKAHTSCMRQQPGPRQSCLGRSPQCGSPSHARLALHSNHPCEARSRGPTQWGCDRRRTEIAPWQARIFAPPRVAPHHCVAGRTRFLPAFRGRSGCSAHPCAEHSASRGDSYHDGFCSRAAPARAAARARDATPRDGCGVVKLLWIYAALIVFIWLSFSSLGAISYCRPWRAMGFRHLARRSETRVQGRDMSGAHPDGDSAQNARITVNGIVPAQDDRTEHGDGEIESG